MEQILLAEIEKFAILLILMSYCSIKHRAKWANLMSKVRSEIIYSYSNKSCLG